MLRWYLEKLFFTYLYFFGLATWAFMKGHLVLGTLGVVMLALGLWDDLDSADWSYRRREHRSFPWSDPLP
jgi:hypothetical protein